jgi:hypothetical protein
MTIKGVWVFSSLREVKGNLSSRELFTQLMEIESNTNITTKTKHYIFVKYQTAAEHTFALPMCRLIHIFLTTFS